MCLVWGCHYRCLVGMKVMIANELFDSFQCYNEQSSKLLDIVMQKMMVCPGMKSTGCMGSASSVGVFCHGWKLFVVIWYCFGGSI